MIGDAKSVLANEICTGPCNSQYIGSGNEISPPPPCPNDVLVACY